MSHLHFIFYLFEEKDDHGVFKNSTKFDMTAETLPEAIKKAKASMAGDPNAEKRRFVHLADVVEHHDNHDGIVKLPVNH